MEKYIIIQKKAFEKMAAFEKRVNEQARKGYKALNLATNGGIYAVLMEKVS